MSFVIFDTEYTSWENCQKTGWIGNQKREIAQIAALKVSDDLKVISEFSRYCQPKINPVLSDYFVQLTGITNHLIQTEGVPFEKAYYDFKDFAGTDICFSHAWGRDYQNLADGNVMNENKALYNMPSDTDILYRNIAPVFQTLYQNNQIDIPKQASGQIVKLLKLEDQLPELHLDEHNALFDVYSILLGLRHFAKRVQDIPLMNQDFPS